MNELLAPIGIDIWTILVAIANTLILTLVLKKFLFEKVKTLIDDRENEIKGIYSDANKTKNDAKALKENYENDIKNAKDKALEIVSEATLNASKRSESIISQANSDALDIKNKALDTIELEKKKALLDIKEEISELVTSAASKVLEKELDGDTHKKLIDDFISEV